jgi:ribosomal protein L35
MKTHKGTAKRVRVTATGKVMVRAFNPKRAKRRRTDLHEHRGDVPAHASVVEQVRKNLPYAKSTPQRRKQA